jgi:hypothetical protein
MTKTVNTILEAVLDELAQHTFVKSHDDRSLVTHGREASQGECDVVESAQQSGQEAARGTRRLPS